MGDESQKQESNVEALLAATADKDIESQAAGLEQLSEGSTQPASSAEEAAIAALINGSPPKPRDEMSEEALKALADGLDVTPGADPESAAPADSGQAGPGDAAHAIPAFANGPATSARRSAVISSARQKSAAHHFRKTIAPLLLVVGIILLLLGGLVAVMDASGQFDAATAGAKGVFSGPVRKLLIYSSFPMGLFLIFGAWWFHRSK